MINDETAFTRRRAIVTHSMEGEEEERDERVTGGAICADKPAAESASAWELLRENLVAR